MTLALDSAKQRGSAQVHTKLRFARVNDCKKSFDRCATSSLCVKRTTRTTTASETVSLQLLCASPVDLLLPKIVPPKNALASHLVNGYFHTYMLTYTTCPACTHLATTTQTCPTIITCSKLALLSLPHIPSLPYTNGTSHIHQSHYHITLSMIKLPTPFQ
jgi:hypothetical protein